VSGIGPITIFDKSALQSFNPDEALWFDWFYKTNITPLFYVETLADLNKQMHAGRTPEQLVGNIADKTPVIGSELNIPHRTLCLHDLLGERVRMKRLPVVGRGRSVKTGDRMGMIIEQPPEMEAFERWQRRDFLDVERLYARAWRQGLEPFDLRAILANFGLPEHRRLQLDLFQAKQWAETFVRGERHRFSLLKEAMEILSVPGRYKPEIIRRWKLDGGPPFCEFAPYAAHILKVNLFSYLGLAAGHLSAKKNSLVDIAYLYYLPFCMVFVSGDKLHRTAPPYFLGHDQAFIWAPDLKAELARLDAHFSKLPEHVRAQGMYSFASSPPEEGEFLTTQLWDRFLPAWRRRTEQTPASSPEAHAHLLAQLNAMDSAPETSAHVTSDNASYIIRKRMVPVSSGKWRIMPAGIGDKPGT
jgi:hypothetical protein